MKKLNRRALSVMMISLFIILGLFTYIERFLRDGERPKRCSPCGFHRQ